MTIPGHIILDESDGSADCGICNMGLMPGDRFGPISRADLLAAFVTDHATHDKRGNPSGLTPGGRPTKAAREALTTRQQAKETR